MISKLMSADPVVLMVKRMISSVRMISNILSEIQELLAKLD